MAGSRDGLGVGAAAAGAGVGLDTGSGAGGSGGHLGGVAMAGSRDGLGVAIAALGAGVGLDTGGGAGSSSGHLGAVAVAALGGGSGVADRQGIVAVDGQAQSDLNAAGDQHLLRGTGGGVVEGAGGAGNIRLGHVPGTVVGGLDTDIAVGIEGDGELAIHELVAAHVGVVILAAIVGTVDVAEQIVVGGRGGTGAAGRGTAAVAQGQAAVTVVAQGQGIGACGNDQLVGVGQVGLGIQRDRGHFALPAVGHVLGAIDVGDDPNVHGLVKGDSQLAVNEGRIPLVVADAAGAVAPEQVVGVVGHAAAGAAAARAAAGVGAPGTGGGAVLILAIGGDGQVRGLAGAIVEDDIGSIRGDLDGIDAAADQRHSGAGPGAVVRRGACPRIGVDAAPVGAGVVVVDGLGGSGSAAGGAAASAFAGGIAQGDGAVRVHHHLEVDGHAGGDHQLVGIAGDVGQGVQGGRGDLALPAIGHVLGAVAVADPDIAGLVELHGHLAVHEAIVVAVVGIGAGGVEDVVVVSQEDLALIDPVTGGQVVGVTFHGGGQVGGLGAAAVVEDQVGDTGRNRQLIVAVAVEGHLVAGPGIGNSVSAAVVPAVQIDVGPAVGVLEVDGLGGGGAADGAGGAGLVAHILIAVVAVAVRAVGGVRAGGGGSVVDDRHAAVTDVAVDPAIGGDGEGVAGDLIDVGTGGQAMVGNAGPGSAAGDVDDHDTGVAALDVSEVAIGGAVLALAGELVLEPVDRLNGRIRPAGLGDVAHFLIQHIVGTGEVQAHGVGTSSHQRVGPVQGVAVDLMGVLLAGAGVPGLILVADAIPVGIVGLSPQHQLVRVAGLEVAVLDGAGGTGLHEVTDVVGPCVLGDAHVLGVSGDGQGAGLVGVGQHLAVVVEHDATGGGGVIGRAVDHGGPEVAGEGVVVIGGLDLLSRVVTEAVSAAVDAVLQVVQNVVLDLVAAGVQVGQLHGPLGDVVAVRVVGRLDIVLSMPAGAVVEDVGGDQGGGIDGIAAVIRQMVGDHVHDDTDAILVGLVTQLDELVPGADGVVLVLVEVEADGLIQDPPVVEGLIDRALLALLRRGDLDAGIAQVGDQAQIGLDVVERPVPALQGSAVLNILGQGGAAGRAGGGIVGGSLDRHFHGGRQVDQAGDQRQSQQQSQ